MTERTKLVSSTGKQTKHVSWFDNSCRIKLLTLNIKGLPIPIERDSISRANKVAEILRESDYDIICLQEVFDNEVREILVRKLEQQYPFIIEKSKYHFPCLLDNVNWLQDSGLFFASKYKILWHQFVPFLNCEGLDSLAFKGTLGTCIQISDDSQKEPKSLMVFTTHLNAHHSETALKQLDEIMSFINQQNYTNLVLCGDFNIDERGGNYNELISKTNGIDLFRKMFPDIETDPGFTIDSDLNHNMVSGDAHYRVDYLLDLSPGGSKNLEVNNIKLMYAGEVPDNLLSDHFGVEMEIEPPTGNNKGNYINLPRFTKFLPRLFYCCTGCI